MKNRKKLAGGCSVLLLIAFTSCVEVKEYQRNFLNDSDMEVSQGLINSYENNFQNYRESATGGNSGKTGGGCGCN